MTVNREKEEFALDAVITGILDVRADGSIWRVKTRSRTGRLRDIEPTRVDRARPDGYRYVSVCANGREFKVLVHRLVWLATGQPIPDGHDINHRDGDRGNNRRSNLEPLLPGANLGHSYRELGRPRPVGERNSRGRLTREQVREIHALYAAGAGQRELGRRFNVSHRAIRMVVTGQSWRDEYPQAVTA